MSFDCTHSPYISSKDLLVQIHVAALTDIILSILTIHCICGYSHVPCNGKLNSQPLKQQSKNFLRHLTVVESRKFIYRQLSVVT